MSDGGIIKRAADISPCGKYRYTLLRSWHGWEPEAVFIMLNPSTADANVDDPTIRRCAGFARALGCGGLVVINLFAVRATKPADMMRAADPIGPDNHAFCVREIAAAGRAKAPVICAWGARGAHMDQDRNMLGWIDAAGVSPTALGLTKDGHPRHPLYLPAAARPTPFQRRA